MTFLGLGPGYQGSAVEKKEKGCEPSELPAVLVCAQQAAQTEAIAAGHCASPAGTGLPHEPWVLEYCHATVMALLSPVVALSHL